MQEQLDTKSGGEILLGCKTLVMLVITKVDSPNDATPSEIKFLEVMCDYECWNNLSISIGENNPNEDGIKDGFDLYKKNDLIKLLETKELMDKPSKDWDIFITCYITK